jgi:two-component system, NtrC family, response regulator HydG
MRYFMKAQDLKIQELVDFSRGKLNLHGRRLVLHDLHALAQLRKDLVEMVGFGQARRILTRLVFFGGTRMPPPCGVSFSGTTSRN